MKKAGTAGVMEFGAVGAGVGPACVAGEVARPSDSAAAPKHKFPLGRWTVFRNPFSKAPKPAVASVRVPLQGELSLDLVKPVRNDLSDSDVVVVPGPTPGVASAAKGAAEAALVEPVWSRIKTQWFGAEKG